MCSFSEQMINFARYVGDHNKLKQVTLSKRKTLVMGKTVNIDFHLDITTTVSLIVLFQHLGTSL